MREISASQFKAKCLAMLDDVADSGSELVITKRGKPVAKVSRVDSEDADLRGSVTYLVDGDQLLEPIGVEWEAAPGS